jgi:hypothetical protein
MQPISPANGAHEHKGQGCRHVLIRPRDPRLDPILVRAGAFHTACAQCGTRAVIHADVSRRHRKVAKSCATSYLTQRGLLPCALSRRYHSEPVTTVSCAITTHPRGAACSYN